MRVSETDPGRSPGTPSPCPGTPAQTGRPLVRRRAAGCRAPRCRLRDQWTQASVGRRNVPGCRGSPPGNATRSTARGPPGPGRGGTHPRLHPGRSVASADAAWAAADTLHVAARALRNPSLRCAALLRPCGPCPVRALPRRSCDGDQLRAPPDNRPRRESHRYETLIAITLVAQLVALAAAVAELRRLSSTPPRRRPARARPPLHSAVTQIRSQVPHFGHADAPRSAKTASAPHTARRDFPAGWKPTQPPTDGEDPQRSESGCLSQDASCPRRPAWAAEVVTDCEPWRECYRHAFRMDRRLRVADRCRGTGGRAAQSCQVRGRADGDSPSSDARGPQALRLLADDRQSRKRRSRASVCMPWARASRW